MSRGQQGNVLSQATKNSNAYNTEAQTSFNTENTDLANEQTDIDNYGSEVGQFAAANPYVNGGQAETATNTALADTAAGMGESAGQAVQGAAVRTGQNSGGAIAATKNLEETNQRNLAGEEATATGQRLAAGTNYGEAVLGAQAKIPGMESTLTGQQEQEAATQGGLAQSALSTEEQAAQTPSFLDELGQGFITAGTNFAGGFGQGYGKAVGCWIAAAVFGEDFLTGVKTSLVRNWLWNTWIHNWYAKPVLWLYAKFGERAARRPMVVRILKPLFEIALRKAVSRG